MHVELHYSQMHFAFDLHNRMDSFFSELVSYFSLNVKIAKPFGNALTTTKKKSTIFTKHHNCCRGKSQI
jgi:hypothetical protein